MRDVVVVVVVAAAAAATITVAAAGHGVDGSGGIAKPECLVLSRRELCSGLSSRGVQFGELSQEIPAPNNRYRSRYYSPVSSARVKAGDIQIVKTQGRQRRAPNILRLSTFKLPPFTIARERRNPIFRVVHSST